MSYQTAFRAGLKPDPYLTVSQYSDLKMRIPRECGKEHGKLRLSRTPYLIEPLDCLSVYSPVLRVTVVKPTQIGFTQAAICWLFYIRDTCPSPTMFALPTGELLKRHVKSKIIPSMREMGEHVDPSIFSGVKDKRSEELFIKEFPGGFWQFVSAGSVSALRSVSVRFLIKDDLSGWDLEINKEGDSGELIDKRTDSYGSSAKIFEISTPIDLEVCRVTKSYNKSDQSQYYLPCPHCHQEQVLEFGSQSTDFGLKWEPRNTQSAKYLCRHCHTLIPEYQKTWMLANGHWIPKYPERRYHRGFHINALYSPIGWVSWGKIIDEFLGTKYKAGGKSDPIKLQVFQNTRLGLTWESEGDRPEWSNLQKRAEIYQHILVSGATILKHALILTAGVDVQKNRIAVIILGWGRGEECWVLFWGEVFGDPERPEIWAELDTILDQTYTHELGTGLNLSCTCIDSGFYTQIVYNYTRSRNNKKKIATKGQSSPHKPVIGRPTLQDVNTKGKIIKSGVQVWPIGVATAKGIIYPRLHLTSGPGTIHFYSGLDSDFYEQMTSEKEIIKYTKHGPVKEWFLPSGVRNEALDCFVLAYAAAIKIGLNRIPWDRLELSICGELLKPVIAAPAKDALLQVPVTKTLPKQRPKLRSMINNLTLRNR